MTWQALLTLILASILAAVAYGLAMGRRPEPWYGAFPFFCGVLVYGLLLVLLPLWIH